MKYKTLFRVLLKVLGVWLFLGGVQGAIASIAQLFAYLYEPSFGGRIPAWTWAGLSVQVVPISIGLYLFFGGEWITNKAIPSNRPYCPDCGYDLSSNTSLACPECGTPIPSEEVI